MKAPKPPLVGCADFASPPWEAADANEVGPLDENAPKPPLIGCAAGVAPKPGFPNTPGWPKAGWPKPD